MSTHDVNLGIGNYSESDTTGMFYHAAAGTALPTYPGETLASGWSEVGAVSSDGITLNLNHTFEPLKNWANKTERLLASEDSGTIGVPVLDTTQESFETIFGADNVTTTAATSTHGALISVEVTKDTTPDAEAYLFLVRDDDDMIMIGTTKGYITEIGEVAFQPNAAITWDATITADSWTIMKDDGQTA